MLDMPKPEVDWPSLRRREFVDDMLSLSTDSKEECDIRGWNYCENWLNYLIFIAIFLTDSMHLFSSCKCQICFREWEICNKDYF